MRITRFVLAAACAAAALTAPAATAEPTNPLCRYLHVYDPVSGNTYLIKPCDYIPEP